MVNGRKCRSQDIYIRTQSLNTSLIREPWFLSFKFRKHLKWTSFPLAQVDSLASVSQHSPCKPSSRARKVKPSNLQSKETMIFFNSGALPEQIHLGEHFWSIICKCHGSHVERYVLRRYNICATLQYKTTQCAQRQHRVDNSPARLRHYRRIAKSL